MIHWTKGWMRFGLNRSPRHFTEAFRLKPWIRITWAAFLLEAFTSLALAQCAMCKSGLTSSPEGQQMAAGYNSGILYLMMMPYLLVGTVALVIYIGYRK